MTKQIQLGKTYILKRKGEPDEEAPFTLSPEEREGGIYIEGKPRTGKTTFIVNMMLQDAINDMGFFFIDPHGDATYDLLARLPIHRLKDVILLDPTMDKHAFSINLFECHDPTDIREVSGILSSVIQVFSKLFSDGETSGITLETTLLNVTVLLIYNQQYTLADVGALLEEKDALLKLVNNIDQDWHFDNYRWWLRYIQMKKTDQDKETASTIRRLMKFNSDALLRHIVGQPKNSIDFRKIIDSKTIVLLKLPRKIETVANTTASLVLDRFLHAAFSRDDTDKQDRPYYGLYCDEFQNYATPDLAKLFTETGKYHILPILAHQERKGQLHENDLVDAATLTAPHTIIFTLNTNDAEVHSRSFVLDSPPGEPIKDQVRERQYRNETVITWEPPESEQYYQTELQRLKEKKENAFLRAGILYSAVFGKPQYVGFLYMNNIDINIPKLLEELTSVNDFYSIESYNKTGSFVIPKTHTRGWSKEQGGTGGDSSWTEHGSYEYTLDPINNALVQAFTPKLSHKEALVSGKHTQPPYYDPLEKFDTHLQENDLQAKQKRRAALQSEQNYSLTFPLVPVPFTFFLGNLERPIKEGVYDYFSLKANPHIEICIQFPYNSNKPRELERTKEGNYIVPAQDKESSKTYVASREIGNALANATYKHRSNVQYIRDVENKDLQEKWINDLKQDSSIFWKWRYFEEAAYWFLLACQELAKQIVTFTKELEDFAKDYPAQHMKTTVFKRDTGIDIPVMQFMGYRSFEMRDRYRMSTEPEYQPMYTTKPGKDMYTIHEMIDEMRKDIENIPPRTAYARISQLIQGVPEIRKYKIVTQGFPPEQPHKRKRAILVVSGRSVQVYYQDRNTIQKEINQRRKQLFLQPPTLPQESEVRQEEHQPNQPKTLPQDTEEEIQREEKPEPQKKPTPRRKKI